MKNKIIMIVVLMIIIILLGIGFVFTNVDESVNIDSGKLIEELINSQIFEDNLSVIDKETVIKEYGFDAEKINNVEMYSGTGATAEKILIVELVDKSYVDEVKEIIEKKIEEEKSDFQDYLPEEVFKLENYNLEVKGNYIILCISNDYDKAKEIININS